MELLNIKSLPYFLTFLIFLLGWSLNRVIDSTYDSPSIEYNLTHEDIGRDTGKIVLTVTNISQKTLFKDLVFYFNSNRSNGSHIIDRDMTTISPAFQGYTNFDPESEYSAVFNISHLHPTCSYIMEVEYFKDQPKMQYGSDSQAVILKEASFSTWIVKNEFIINIGLAGLWLLSIVLYFYYINKRSNAPKKKPYA